MNYRYFVGLAGLLASACTTPMDAQLFKQGVSQQTFLQNAPAPHTQLTQIQAPSPEIKSASVIDYQKLQVKEPQGTRTFPQVWVLFGNGEVASWGEGRWKDGELRLYQGYADYLLAKGKIGYAQHERITSQKFLQQNEQAIALSPLRPYIYGYYIDREAVYKRVDERKITLTAATSELNQLDKKLQSEIGPILAQMQMMKAQQDMLVAQRKAAEEQQKAAQSERLMYGLQMLNRSFNQPEQPAPHFIQPTPSFRCSSSRLGRDVVTTCD